MEEKKCPICNISIRSDATTREFCKLCGMAIPNPKKAHHNQTKPGVTNYFCCYSCFSIYNNVIQLEKADEKLVVNGIKTEQSE